MDSDQMNEWNKQVIEEFRANGGKVGGQFEGADLLLLHHTGAKSGTERVNPLMYRADDDRYAIFASKAGAPDNPDWYHNLKANPRTTIEVGNDRVDVVAKEASGTERDRIWEAQKADVAQFGEYERSTSRTIPVMILEPTS